MTQTACTFCIAILRELFEMYNCFSNHLSYREIFGKIFLWNINVDIKLTKNILTLLYQYWQIDQNIETIFHAIVTKLPLFYSTKLPLYYYIGTVLCY